MKKLHYTVFLFLLFSGTAAWCQNNNSPFSIIGIGDIDNNNYNRTSGIANTGMAYRSDRYIIDNNPASYTALQLQFLHFELSGRAQFVTYTGDPLNDVSNSSKDFAIKRLSIATKVTKWWGTGIGLRPFSTSNYQLTSVKNIQGSSSPLPVQYEGTGGVNQIFWGNGFQVTKHFSVGFNLSYLFGSLTQTESLATSDLQTALVTTRQFYLRKLYFSYGAQYYFALNKKWDVALGGTFSNKTDLNTQSTVQITNNGVVVPNTPAQQDGKYRLPGSAGGGFRIVKNKRYSFSVDYQYQPWSNTNYSGTNYTLQNSNRISAGFEVSNKRAVYKELYERSYFQAGVYYGNSYLNVNGKQLNDMGINLGYGLTSFKNPLGAAISLELGQRGTTQNGLVKETYVNINFTISHIDQLLTKGRKYF